MKHAVQSITTTVYSAAYLTNGVVAQATEGKFSRSRAAPGGFINIVSGTVIDKAARTTTSGSKYSHSLVSSAVVVTNRRHEDMTSRRIEHVEAESDHELLCELSSFRENKKKRPPEAGNLMQVQGEYVNLQPRNKSAGPKPLRSDSTPGVAFTPEICGESDLTAENHMAEESSRSSNNGGSSMLESAADSRGSSREFRSVSSLGVLHCFLDQSDGGKRRDEAGRQSSSEGPSILAENDDQGTRKEIKDSNNHADIAKLEPATTNQQRGSGSATEAPSSGTITAPPHWGRRNQEWLQLGLGSSRRGETASSKHSDLATDGRPPPSPQGDEGRNFAKRKITTPMESPIAENSETFRNMFPEISNATGLVQWQIRRSSFPPKAEISVQPLCNPTPATLSSIVQTSGLIGRTAGVSEVIVPSYDVEKMDLCLFGSSIPTSSGSQLGLGPPSGPLARKCSGDASSSGIKGKAKASLVSGFVTDDAFAPHREHCQEVFQDVVFPSRNQEGVACIVGTSGVYNRNVTSCEFTSTPTEDAQIRSSHTGMEQELQFHRDSGPSSLSALMQTREDQRQAGFSWVCQPESAQFKLIPVAKNFQGWSSELTASSMKPAADATLGVHQASNPTDVQVHRSDEWGSLFRKVSPNMLFQSQGQVPEAGSSVASACILKSTGPEKSSFSNEAQDNLAALKREIEKIQKRPQWTTTTLEASNLGPVASWCLNGKVPPGLARSDAKLESCVAGGESFIMSPMLSDKVPAHSRFAGDRIQNTKAPQRQSWQPASAAGLITNVNHHGNVDVPNLKRTTSSAPTVGFRPKFQVLPPGSRGTNHAGLWFILQSAENQNGEGGLPQISKAYLRIKDGKMPVSAVKKYLVTKLGLTSESEVEITCKGQPVVPSLPLQHVRDAIWFSSLNTASKDQRISYQGERELLESATDHQQCLRPPPGAANYSSSTAALSKDILMVLTYRRHPRTLISTLMQTT